MTAWASAIAAMWPGSLLVPAGVIAFGLAVRSMRAHHDVWVALSLWVAAIMVGAGILSVSPWWWLLLPVGDVDWTPTHNVFALGSLTLAVVLWLLGRDASDSARVGDPSARFVIGLSLAVGLAILGRQTIAILQEPPRQDLPSTAAAQIVYPGSVLLAETGGPYKNPLRRTFGVEDSSVLEVLAHYEASLSAIGFVEGAGLHSMQTTSETYACAWHADGLAVRIGFWELDEARERWPEIRESARDFRTAYQVLILETPLELEDHQCGSVPSYVDAPP
jgi:hypothetical protein